MGLKGNGFVSRDSVLKMSKPPFEDEGPLGPFWGLRQGFRPIFRCIMLWIKELEENGFVSRRIAEDRWRAVGMRAWV